MVSLDDLGEALKRGEVDDSFESKVRWFKKKKEEEEEQKKKEEISTQPFNKEEAITFWKMLGHEEETELRAIIPQKETFSHHFKTEKEFLELIEKYNGTHNIYLGVNERKHLGTKAEDVLRLKVIPLDIDCIRKPASEEDMIEAGFVVSKIISDCESQGYKSPAVICSGNGYQLFFVIPPIILDEKNYKEIEGKVQEFERNMIEKYSNTIVKLDNVGDLPRIMRVAGTYNIKSKTQAQYSSKEYQEDFLFGEHLMRIKVEQSEINGEIPDELKEKMKGDEIIMSFMNGNLQGRTSRSEAEMSLVCRLVQIGLDKEQIFKVMGACKLGKWQGANINYRELTYLKAIEIITKEKRGESLGNEKEDMTPEQKEEFRNKINECYFNIIGLLDSWVDISSDYKKIIAVWIIGTYFHKDFNTYPYLFFNAMRGSGKTRVLKIISLLQKNGNGEVLTNPSDAVLFRTAKERGLILDEMESEKSKEKQAMREYLNACYKQGGVVYRMEKQKVDGKDVQVAVGHPLFTPVVLANINGIDDVLQDRAITIILEKSDNPIMVKKMEDFSTNFVLIKLKRTLESLMQGNAVYTPLQKGIGWNYYLTKCYPTIHTTHTTTTIHISPTLYTTPEQALTEKDIKTFEKIDKTGINGRNLELFFPLLLIGESISEEVFNELLKLISNLNKSKRDEEFAESKDISLIEFVSLANRYRLEYVMSSELFREFKEFIGNQGTDDESRWLNITWFGSALKRLKLLNHKKRQAKGVLLLLNVDYAKERIKMFRTEEELGKDGENQKI